MLMQETKPTQVIEFPLGNALYRSKTTTILKSPALELIRLVLPAGKEIPAKIATGEITVQCLEGRVTFNVMDEALELTAGHFLFLLPGESHSITAIEDSSLLMTILRPKSKPTEPFDVVQEASEESFPCSDSPAY